MMHFGNGRKGGMMGNRMLPMEPMYLILNVDMSPNWGWPEWHRCGLGESNPNPNPNPKPNPNLTIVPQPHTNPHH